MPPSSSSKPKKPRRNPPRKTQFFERVFGAVGAKMLVPTKTLLIRPSWILCIFLILTIYYISTTFSPSVNTPATKFQRLPPPPPKGNSTPTPFEWHLRTEQHPIPASQYIPLPRKTIHSAKIPQIQAHFPAPSPPKSRDKFEQVSIRKNEEHLIAVERAFKRSWQGYRNHGWGKDFLGPVSGQAGNGFGGFAVTLVEALDTMLIMGMDGEFEEAMEVVRDLEFRGSEEEIVEVFEVGSRILGGLLGALDACEGRKGSSMRGHREVLLQKAVEVGDFLYGSFDTENRMVVSRWSWKRTQKGEPQEAFNDMLLAELGSMSLEFTHLTQVSGDPKFFDAVQRIADMLEKHQDLTKLPGMWPLVVDASKDGKFDVHNGFTLGSMADWTYECLPKQFLQLAGHSPQPRTMYEKALTTALHHTLFTPMLPPTQTPSKPLLFTALTRVSSADTTSLDPQIQQLSCYVGGMIALGSKIFNRPDDLDVARKLVDGCIWASEIFPSGLMPEGMYVVPCESERKINENGDANQKGCAWDETKWKAGIMERDEKVTAKNINETIAKLGLQPGIVDISDPRFLLRPEIIESIFTLYRITGDQALRDAAWRIFESIEIHTRTTHGNTALKDVRKPSFKADAMESYWTGATLKYFYLIFSDPSLVSLDDYIFSTGGHPFKRPK